MMRSKMTIIMLSAALLSGCQQNTEGASSDNEASSIDTGSQSVATDEAHDVGKTPGFDIISVPVSDAPLGDFPYFSLPDGYTSERRDSFTKDFARFPFWVQGAPVWVEGKFFGASFVPVKGKEMSEFEVKKNFESVITQLGGVKLSEEKIPYDTVKGWGEEITMGFLAGLGDVYNVPATTFVLRRDGGNVWVHLVTNSAQGWYIVGQEKAFEQSASLLPASSLKDAIDKRGKAVVHVNFATDASEILPASQPQVDAIAALLKQENGLRLAINGHTDDTGSIDRNRKLSEERANAVRAALISSGIDADRLTAKGFGSTSPMASNGTAEGKAKNRRVELVKL